MVSLAMVVAEPIGRRLEDSERTHIRLLLRRIGAPWREGHLHVVPGLLGSGLNGCAAAQNNQVGQRDLLSTGLRSVELLLDRLQLLQDLGQYLRLVRFPILLRGETNAGTVRAATLVT